MDIYANEGDRTTHDCTSKMAELESSLTAIDWLTGLKVGITGDCSWSDAGRRMLDTNSVNGSDAATVPQSTEGAGSVGHQKPGYSYSSLIYLAIGSSAERRMTLSEIYRWICDRFPYYRTADPGWKVSFRSPMKYAYNALFRTCRSRFLANVLYAIARPSVCLSSVVCNARAPYPGVQIFGNISTAFGTSAIRWHPWKILQRSSQGAPPSGELHTRGVAKYSDFGPIDGCISQMVQDRR